VAELTRWRERQTQWASRLGDAWHNQHGLGFTTKTGRPISKRNIARAFERARRRAGVDHGTLKTLRSTVAVLSDTAVCAVTVVSVTVFPAVPSAAPSEPRSVPDDAESSVIAPPACCVEHSWVTVVSTG
jgi:hypothetical protein